jgi:FixJ family two-component response regulator
MFDFVQRRLRARRERERRPYLANLATMSADERRELEVLEEMMRTGGLPNKVCALSLAIRVETKR